MYINTLDPFLRKNCGPLISNHQALKFSIWHHWEECGVSLHGTVSELQDVEASLVQCRPGWGVLVSRRIDPAGKIIVSPGLISSSYLLSGTAQHSRIIHVS